MNKDKMYYVRLLRVLFLTVAALLLVWFGFTSSTITALAVVLLFLVLLSYIVDGR